MIQTGYKFYVFQPYYKTNPVVKKYILKKIV